MYYALELSKEMQTRVMNVFRRFFEIPEEWKVYCDHITLIHSSHKDWKTASKLLRNFIGTNVQFAILRVGISYCAMAFEVDTLSVNEHSHITICVAPDHKPVESNNITDWEKLYCDECFTGKLVIKN